eukprot:15374472-Alexandrium_andersonii.AAC.1
MSPALNSFISVMKLTPTLGPWSVRSAMVAPSPVPRARGIGQAGGASSAPRKAKANPPPRKGNRTRMRLWRC